MIFAQAGEERLSADEINGLVAAIENVDRGARSLQKLYQTIAGTMADRGAIACRDAARYNYAAISVYQAQSAIVDALKSAGMPGVAALPPFPALIVDRKPGPNGPFSLNCKLDQVYVTPNEVAIYLQHPQSPDLAKTTPQAPLGLAPLVAWLGIVGSAAVIAYFTKETITAVAKEKSVRAAVEASARNYQLEIDQMRWRLGARMQAIAECVRRSPAANWLSCLAATNDMIEATPPPPNLAALAKALREESGPARAWLWWVGLGTVVVGVTVAGVLIYQRRRRAPRRELAPAAA